MRPQLDRQGREMLPAGSMEFPREVGGGGEGGGKTQHSPFPNSYINDVLGIF